jgi:cytochrome c-type biogenesis protein
MFAQCIAPTGILGQIYMLLDSGTISIGVAFVGGLLSFLAPCVLPLIPGAIAYLAGATGEDRNSKIKRIKHTLFLVLGFIITFVILGVLLGIIFSSIHFSYFVWLRRFGGIVICLFALVNLGIIPFHIFKTPGVKFIKGKISYLKSFIFGALFGLAWTPCSTPVLGSILGLSLTNLSSTILLFLFYSLGLALPFIVTSYLGSDLFIRLTKKSEWLYSILMSIFSLVLLFIGTLMLFQ